MREGMRRPNGDNRQKVVNKQGEANSRVGFLGGQEFSELRTPAKGKGPGCAQSSSLRPTAHSPGLLLRVGTTLQQLLV